MPIADIVGRDGQVLARTISGKGGLPPAAASKPPALVKSISSTPTAPTILQLAPEAVRLGVRADNAAQPIGIDLGKLLDGRLLIQGVSGAGKSWTLRRFLEQCAGQIQRVVMDPEGEFRDLAEKTGMLHVDGHMLDGPSMAELGRRVRAHRISVVIDLSQMTREEQLTAIAGFFLSIIEAPKEQWHPAIVAIDEAHLFAPFGGEASASGPVRKAAIAAVVDLMSRGRKRGLAGILATQRLARLSKSVVSEVQNFLIGMNTLDLDVRRAAETIGWSARTAFDRLPALEPGGFFASGPAFSMSSVEVRVGPVISRHAGERPKLVAPSVLDAAGARELVDLGSLLQASADGSQFKARDDAGPKAVRSFLRNPRAILAAKIATELRQLRPKGATTEAMAKHFKAKPDDVAAAVALLELNGVAETNGDVARLTAEAR